MLQNAFEKSVSSIQERKRIASWWVRWNDLNWPNVDSLDCIKAKAEKMAKANVTTAMIFGAHFRWDYLPYFTLLHDYLATVAEELHKCSVELYDHHSVNLIHRYDTREEMRHVMLHSGPHLPFSPSREAAATWEYNGKRLNDWRMIDVKTGDVLYYPQYAAEGFCYRNPAFIESYKHYVTKLLAETGIDGLSADDPVHYMHYNSCACPYCRAELKRRAGIDLPSIDDSGFWGNWENPAWKEWIDLRFDAASEFFKELASVLPQDFRLTTCGSNSAATGANGKGSDARSFLGGCNYVNLEMSGNTPPYPKDPVTVNIKIADRLINSSHHQACAREKEVRCFATGFGFTEETANIVWAVNKMLDSDCWFSTLKDRLGLPNHILNTLPDEADIVGKAFGFEKEHPELFRGRQIGQLGVYFSYETRKHTYFGNLDKGYYKDYSTTLRTLFHAGISPHTVFSFPKDPAEYPLILLPSAAKMTDAEFHDLHTYLSHGGKVIATGPNAMPECKNAWALPTHPDIEKPTDFFSFIVNGVQHRAAKWTKETTIPPIHLGAPWQEVAEGLFYNPQRISDGELIESFLSLCRKYIRPLPLRLLDSEGYLVTMFEDEETITVHLLAEEFDTDIDHHLDEIRFHRSRVNYVNKAEPIGVTQTLRLESQYAPVVYIPFQAGKAVIESNCGIYNISLPQKTSYMILQFKK